MVQDFEPDLTSLILRPFDDGRFIVTIGAERVFDREKTGKFPNYDEEIKPALARHAEG
ncbi:MAG: hypothetical protein NVS2B16_13410 [Chloroflexota bacterium]